MQIDQSTLDAIVREVVRYISQCNSTNGTKKRILALFCGSSSGLSDACATLEGKDAETIAMATSYAEIALGRRALRNALPTARWLEPGDYAGVMQAFEQAEAVVIPVLTLDMAAKFAWGAGDDPISIAVARAFMDEKPVIAAIDACVPGLIPKPGGICENGAYRRKMIENLVQLQRFGAVLTSAAKLENAMENALDRTMAGFSIADAKAKGKHTSCNKFLTRTDVIILPRLSTLRLKRDTLITPAARDAIRERGIAIAYEQ